MSWSNDKKLYIIRNRRHKLKLSKKKIPKLKDLLVFLKKKKEGSPRKNFLHLRTAY